MCTFRRCQPFKKPIKNKIIVIIKFKAGTVPNMEIVMIPYGDESANSPVIKSHAVLPIPLCGKKMSKHSPYKHAFDISGLSVRPGQLN